MDKVTKEVWFTLTDEEIIDRAKSAAQVRNEALAIEWEMKDYAKAQKKLIEKKESELSDLMQQIRTGRESRILSCSVEKDYTTRHMKYFFDGKLVDERPMTAEERQMTFDVVAGGKSEAN